jgi:hypothetical protein
LKELTSNTSEYLSRKGLDLMSRERGETIVSKKIINAHPEELRHQTYVIAMVKPIQQMYAFTKNQDTVSF